jgi:hypothetical protein
MQCNVVSLLHEKRIEDAGKGVQHRWVYHSTPWLVTDHASAVLACGGEVVSVGYAPCPGGLSQWLTQAITMAVMQAATMARVQLSH